jgi:hypothetical protein
MRRRYQTFVRDDFGGRRPIDAAVPGRTTAIQALLDVDQGQTI